MRPRCVLINLRWVARMLAWSALITTTVLLALLLQSLAASALVPPRSAEPPAACRSTAGAALADGDDVRARFLADLCRTASAPAAERLAVGCGSACDQEWGSAPRPRAVKHHSDN